jgi:glycine cleavage system H protein
MSEVPENLRYSTDHDWVRLEDDGSVVIGITDHAQEALGELVYVEVPEAGQSFQRGDACAVVESVKAASDVNAPVSGELAAINPALEENPDLVNQDPYDEGWLIRLNPSSPAELDDLLDADAYNRLLAEAD